MAAAHSQETSLLTILRARAELLGIVFLLTAVVAMDYLAFTHTLSQHDWPIVLLPLALAGNGALAGWLLAARSRTGRNTSHEAASRSRVRT